ncbi:MAG: flagellar type III secretion system pore protein FliP [Candidatus Krumholzibacteria bacterium]|nr:flagellar type III secretion system pore protein FliP [Candidatus Krumholzibacteria bacterium]MDP6797083.1 flagellar type III secretion system pore protein FliP [Candidatus Krumholzibacteria bacterium]MDP7020941.1 flagellar type III secretion system pore protein FliP [Candidatus Krumholzibacteria bacterium]
MRRQILIIAALTGLVLATSVHAVSLPGIQIGIGEGESTGNLSTSLQVLIGLTILSLAPAILILMTGFTRIVVVMGFLRQAMGTQQMPPNQLIIGLSLFLTFAVMSPVFERVHQEAIAPYLAEEIEDREALKKGMEPLRHFMLAHAQDKDLELFLKMGNRDVPESRMETPLTVVIPAFVLSELKTAFQIGFVLYVPFLVIDMVVASILMSMGMMMLPPVMISLPFKILLFVLVDGWNLVVRSLLVSFQ